MKKSTSLALGALLATAVFAKIHFVEAPNVAPAANPATPAADTTQHVLLNEYEGNSEDATRLHQDEFFRNTGISADNGHLGLSP
jgi:hypothetical protein